MRPWLGFRAARAAWRFAADTRYRNTMLLKLERPAGLFQPDNLTKADRYPDVFAFAADALRALPEPRILSFGCSTGEEVFTLRRYLPEAWIKGVDINRWNLASCARRLRRAPDVRISFERAGSVVREPPGVYDAIFCMAVFRHGALGDFSRDSCADFIRFSDFETTIADLAERLKAGGLLFIEHSNFRMSDTRSAGHFEAALSYPDRGHDPSTPIYDRHNRLIADEANRHVAFRKVGERGRVSKTEPTEPAPAVR